MLLDYIIAIAAFAGMFILFLVMSRTLNNTVNHLSKLEYLMKKELELQKETLAIKRMMTAAMQERQAEEAEAEGSGPAPKK